jgi:serine/threonine-protein kinase
MPTPNADDPLRTTDHTPAPIPQAPLKTVTNDGQPDPALTGQAAVPDRPTQAETRDGSSAPASPAPPAIPGYEIEGVLGRGGMGVVYRARHLALKRTVALKMMLAGGHAGPRELARFRLEAEAVARLQHANIVQIHEVGEAGGHPYCALEYVAGGSLAGKLDGQPMPARDAAQLVETLARAMQLAHSRNVVHRDLKPANVLLTEDGTAKITDFGLARQLDGGSGQTQSGMVMGTPSYMAPEQAAGKSREVGPAADIYALGAILYECLTGRPPFRAPNLMETLRQVMNDEPVPPTQLQSRCPRDLETICLKCLHKEGVKRYASPAALADDLQRFLDGRPILARPVGGVERALKWARRRPATAALLGMSLLAVLAVAVFSVALFESNEELKTKIHQLDEANLEKDGVNAALVKEKEVSDNAQQEAVKRGKEAVEKGVELQQRVEQLRVFLFAGQVQKAISQAESDPRVALDSLLDQRLCLPWLRDFAWGTTYRRARAYQTLPMGAN